jgi:hypothetical protein
MIGGQRRQRFQKTVHPLLANWGDEITGDPSDSIKAFILSIGNAEKTGISRIVTMNSISKFSQIGGAGFRSCGLLPV